jgi:hypothetical protein
MSVSIKHVVEHGPMLRALGRTAFGVIAGGTAKASVPGPWIEAEVRAPSQALVRAFVDYVGADRSAYRTTLPPALFPQWALPVASRAMAGVPYPMHRVLNAGCRVEVREALPIGARLHVRARLESIDETDERALIGTRVITGTEHAPEAIVADLRAFVPLARAARDGRTSPPVVPAGARELRYLELPANAGLAFAKLTGDFNPIHWVRPVARRAGFRGCILHGFGTLAFAMEAIVRNLMSGAPLRAIDVRFTRPLVLPAAAAIYTTDDRGLFVGDGPGGLAYLVGRYDIEEPR